MRINYNLEESEDLQDNKEEKIDDIMIILRRRKSTLGSRFGIHDQKGIKGACEHAPINKHAPECERKAEAVTNQDEYSLRSY